MPQTTASGDDAVVGTKVPSTTADSSKEMRTTLPHKSALASSSNISDARNAEGGALINKPLPKFDIKKLSVKSICVNFLVLVCRFLSLCRVHFNSDVDSQRCTPRG